MVQNPENAEWEKRASRFTCREPYKTMLDTLAQHWIEGTLSDASLGLELWKVHHQCRDALQSQEEQRPVRLLRRKTLDLSDVECDLLTLADALCYSSEIAKVTRTAEDRQEWLQFAKLHPLTRASFRSR